MLWMVKTVLMARAASQRAAASFKYSGTRAVCQSLQWMTSGRPSMAGSMATTALEKKAKRSPSSSSPYSEGR